jgi:hypothetical protein
MVLTGKPTWLYIIIIEVDAVTNRGSAMLNPDLSFNLSAIA